MKIKSLFIASAILLAACASTNPVSINSQVESLPTSRLWFEQSTTRDPLFLAFAEAELARRGQNSSGPYYLGNRTLSALDKPLYDRSQPSKRRRGGADLKNCSDFPSSFAAQKYFLLSGGPTIDPHGLDADGDGFACEWGTQLKRTVSKYKANRRIAERKRRAAARRYSTCYTGPRGGTYTITASGRKNYGGC
ncbi:excalibur calcium-binding domain-containing protein [Amylibacter sp. IMCC11727]|uniref:excalibur calcium-binding domain-containing protein n=1 Tax=Amylibacter sp. IMCC11727 TaxID=3039851 RepID=UPI00244DA15A|nr:excalibur calcium-binding domain-containing protein [Amylibacter sp. IMCC11727]WGI20926.1 excalibur calcium-binding domain-containing protein [Amylibacter sp. IMCC11727]